MASKDKCGSATCTKPPGSASLRNCSRCHKVAYCSHECQSAAWPTHKGTCVRANYVIKYHLAPKDIKNPAVVRTLSCTPYATFYMLHMALQTAFEWSTTHSFDFAVKDPDFRRCSSLADHMSLRMAMGPTAEQLPSSASREYLLRVVDPLQATTFSGIDRMHEGTRRHPNTLEVTADKCKLFKLFDDPKYRRREIVYTYDFGDNWEHSLTVIGREDPNPDFACLDGSGHYVAEDVGGVHGWNTLKEAYRARDPTGDQKLRRTWFELQASNADPFGLAGDRVDAWDRESINRALRMGTMLNHFHQMGEASKAHQAAMEAEMVADMGLD